MDGVKEAMGLSKICFYPIDYNIVKATTENVSRDKKQYLHVIDFTDKNLGAVHRIAAICKDESNLIKDVLFDGLKQSDPTERMIVGERGKSVSYLIYQSKRNGGPAFIL